MTAIVLDASAGVEIALQSPIGRQVQAKIPTGATTWVPEHYFVEVTGVLRRDEINRRHSAAKIQVALDRLLGAPVRRVSVRPLVGEAWLLRHNITVAMPSTWWWRAKPSLTLPSTIVLGTVLTTVS